MISSGLRINRPLGKSVRLRQIKKMRECEQVAAVCYRVRKEVVEFLLVQTRGSGRWIFPKGSAEPGLTHAQAAAIEAFEEAGVHGRIEEIPFARYITRKPGDRLNARRSLQVSAHLCEVRRLANPKESNRNRTWFSIDDAKQRLREGRKNDDGEEFARIVQQAVARIRQLRDGDSSDNMDGIHDRPGPHAWQRDELYKVRFEASAETRRLLGQTGRIIVAVGRDRHEKVLPCEVLPFATPRHSNRAPRLLASGAKVKALGAGTKKG
ncbi:MAG: NUDIX domain-containing protein [Candidatus Sulfotelmatobacter sp.]